MRFTSIVCTLSFALGMAGAQTRISGAGKCGKPDMQQMVEVGDRTGHALMLAKWSCTWSEPIEMAGLKAKTYTVVMTSDASGEKSQDRGYVVLTMDNGDKAFVRVVNGTGTMTKEGNSSGEGTWTYTGGTGKLRGLTGKGTYKSTGTKDSGEDHVEGEYALPPAGASKAKTKKN